MKKTVEITIPELRAKSRNKTNGAYFEYASQLTKAENYMKNFGKRFEHHFENPVDVEIIAYFDITPRKVYIKSGVMKGKQRNVRSNAPDTPNIDDKIFTDLLIRYKRQKFGRKFLTIEKPCWFIEDDSPEYLRKVIKQSIPSDHNKIVIRIKEI